MVRMRICIICTLLVVSILPPITDLSAFDKHKLSLSFESDWTNYNIKAIGNSSYQFPNMAAPEQLAPYDGTSRISGGWGLSAAIKYRVSRVFSIGPNFIYLTNGGTEYSRANFLDDYVNRNPIAISNLKVGLLAPGIGMTYQVSVDKIRLKLNGDITWMFGSARYSYPLVDLPPSITKAKYDFGGRGIGYVFSMAPSIPLGKTFLIEPVMGYRFLKTGELKDSEGKRWYNMYLNFSGPFVGMGFGLRSK